jgi:hypothetical protein
MLREQRCTALGGLTQENDDHSSCKEAARVSEADMRLRNLLSMSIPYHGFRFRSQRAPALV